MIEGQCVGLLRSGFVQILADFTSVFRVVEDQLGFVASINEPAERTSAVAQVAQALLQQKYIGFLLDEPYPVKGHNDELFFVIDRSLVPFFGFRSYGQHLNGFVRKSAGLFVWIARRARDRHIFPGMLDNLVAGGLPHGLGLQQNLAKECYEEAGITADIAARAEPVGEITYNAISPKGYKPDTLYCYDLELTEDFTPVSTDGEVEQFELMPVETVMDIVRHGKQFKPNCNLVMIDFFTRHGLLDAKDSEILAIEQSLRVPFMYQRWKS